uniref:CCHC-type domain-containing protein n=1 Tax=Tanacetum cinerariifolium TaxID=118510 RepID=A0A6L2KQ39_TANCI|nr:hypothetical protein [Tanacetum cinerariifolium]
MGKTINELHAMLKLHEQTLPKTTLLLFMLFEPGKNKLAYAPKPKIPPLPKREDLAKDSICHECGETGHWKRNCPQYLAELLKKKKNVALGAGGSGISIIELNTILNRSWIYDTGCGTHTCNTTQGLRASRKLKPEALSLYVGNGQHEAVEAIGVFYLYGFINRFVNNTIQVSRNNMVYFSVIPRDGIFEIDLSNSYTNESSIYAISNKRAKLDLDSALLWHCRLGHISKKPIEKLQHDGLLNSTDLRAFEKCVSCMSGKMTRKPYTHQVERAKDLPGLIYTDNHGIIVHCTPPYTPQHNRVSERRNRTLLDMIQSMMSQTTLPNSFWDYALETAARILNTVPTKKVEKTPYEVWHGQAPKLSYLKVWGCPQGHDMPPGRMCLYIDAKEHKLGNLSEPANYKAALLDPKSDKWLNVMNVKMQSMKDNEVWVLVELPPNGKIVGIDYEETFSLVADIRAIRILIAIAAYYDYEIWKMDVKTAFLNGHLNEEVYIEQPEGFVNPKYPNRVHKLKRSIYGLKQALRQLNKRFDDEIKKFGFTQNRDEPCVYLKASGSNITFLILYVDDILIMGNNNPMLQDVKSWKMFCYERFRYVVGCTRPDVAFAQNVTSRFQQNPGDPHWTNVKNIMKYLKNTKDTEYVFVLNGGAVDWKSAKQSIFATSSAEAECIAAFDASKEAVWVRKFIFGLGVVHTIEEPISMYCDNTGAIAIANESGITKDARHFRAKVHYLREVIEYGDVKLENVHTDDNLADPFAKALAFPKHSEHTRNIGMLPASSLM